MRLGNNNLAFDRASQLPAIEPADAKGGAIARAPAPIEQLPGRLGTIRIFEGDRFRTIPNDPPPTTVSGKSGWDSLGVISSAMLQSSASSKFSAVRGQAHEKSLEGGEQWRDVKSFGPNAWSLDVTAELLSGAIRC
jgi:hypothetical protein